MASSSNQSSSSTGGNGWSVCFCESKAVMETSWSNENPGRRFLGCRHYREGKKCKFFEWVDDEICQRGKVVIPALRDENRKLKLKMKEYATMEMKMKEYAAMEVKKEEYGTMENKVKQYERDLETIELRVQKLVKKEKFWKSSTCIVVMIFLVCLAKLLAV